MLESENGNYFENIQHTSFTYIFIWVRKIGLLTALQSRRIEAAEMKLLRPLAGYTLYDIKQMTTYAANYKLQAY